MEHVTVRDYVERIFDEREKALNLAFSAQQQALVIATRNLDEKLAELNRLRQEVTQDRSSYVTKDTYSADQKASDAWRNQVIGGLSLVRFLGVAGSIGALLEVARISGLLK